MDKQDIKNTFAKFWPKDSAERTLVLYYHAVNPIHPQGMKPNLFREQMKWLKKNCHIVSICDFTKSSRASAKKTVVAITFDDGYEDNYSFAFPILSELGIPATIFFSPKYAGIIPPAEANLYKGLRLFDWAQAREMTKNNISIQSHSFSHCNLGKVSFEKAEDELRISKETIENQLGQEVFAFAYPWGQKGFFSENVSLIAKEMGYKMGFTTIWGKIERKSDSMLLPRLEIVSNDTIQVLKAKISGKYDYLRLIHKIKKIR